MALLFAMGTLFVPVQAVSTPQRTAAEEDLPALVPVGKAIGVKLFADGVLVAALSEDGDAPAKKSGVRSGDFIVTFNHTAIESSEHLQALLKENGTEQVTLGIRREGRWMQISAVPEKGEDGVYRLGAWIRDSMAGIGTVTFYDPQTGRFAALGHGITDVDTGKLMPLARGSVMAASVKAVKRGEKGAPGELRGEFDLQHDLGTLYANTDCGIFGTLGTGNGLEIKGEAIPAARRDEVHTGKAVILANCAGDEVRAYEIEIEKLYSGSSDTRNFLLHVVDPGLLKQTGGIVQGMSGSPVLQDGKLVGAVTHVLVNDASRGYGIFIENMLSAGQLLTAETTSA